MEKNKRDLMILIAILFIGFNYIAYTYFIVDKLDTIKQAKSKYISRTKKLDLLKSEKKSIDVKQQELKKLRLRTASFDDMAPVEINTPELIYDFYNRCKSSGVNGQSISFELLNNDNNSDNANDKNFHTLIIDLEITGSNSNIENFIKNLNTITKRKLNVKSITIGSSDDEKVDNSELEGSSNETKTSSNEVNQDNSYKSVSNTNQNNGELPSEIVFYQYVHGSGNSSKEVPSNYIFYDSQKQGFNSIADMFK